jgi:hypothetical protein
MLSGKWYCIDCAEELFDEYGEREEPIRSRKQTPLWTDDTDVRDKKWRSSGQNNKAFDR